jgi:FtsP/CotA-like multicopper oxidase with cupredoxin domain
MTRWLTLLMGLLWSLAPGELAAQEHGARPLGTTAAPTDTLAAPPVLQNRSTVPGVVEVTLTAAPAHLSLVPGAPTEVYAYNGRIPGPTLELHEGDRVIIHFRNELPEPTTVHWHGLNLPADADGSPFYPVAPGGQFDYVFTIGPGTAGTYWYHPHPDGRAGYQVAKGLYGAIIIRAADDPLPASIPEKLLILSDNRLRPDGSIDLPDPDSPQGQVDMENGREGDVLLVNGQIMPTLPIRSGEVQRWRIINAAAARIFRLALPGQTVLQVGSDGGLFERPVEVGEILLANSERVELLVRGDGPPGGRTMLQTLPYDRYVPQTRPPDWNHARDLVSLAYSPQPPLPRVSLPSTLRPIPALDTGQAVVRRVVVLTQGLINGKAMDMSRVDFHGRLGTTEIWEIENLVGMDHPFHLHGFHFQVLDRNGVTEPSRRWKDTINVPGHETVRFIVRFDGYAGKWMFHCHILDHEDQGMMGVLELN